VITELVIILLPVLGLYNLQMPTKNRLLVIFAFSFRLPYVKMLFWPLGKINRRLLI
jgi:hypothetical protein